LGVHTFRTPTTLWIYAPTTQLLHKEYGLKEDKVFDEQFMDRWRYIMTTIGRVLISSDNTPQFYVLYFADTVIGLDYAIVGSVLDIQKSYAGAIQWPEANRRYVIKGRNAPEAIGDTAGAHLQPYDIRMQDFLAEQIAQRIAGAFQEEDMKKYFAVDKSDGAFRDQKFIFEYAIRQTATPPSPVDIHAKVFEIITYVIQTYEFKDFYWVEILDEVTKERFEVSGTMIWARPKN
jgi:hypothetical protein